MEKTAWKAAIMDWDGTTVRSQRVYYGSFCEALRAAEISLPPFRTFCHEVARMGIIGLYGHYGLLERLPLHTIERIRDAYVETHWGEITPRPKLAELFRACALTGTPFVVMSNNEARVIERKLADWGMSSCVRHIIATDNKRESLSEFIAAHGGEPASFLFVDDTSRDLAMAKQKGATVAGFTKGYGNVREIREIAPHFLVDSLRKVAKLVMNHRER